MDVFDDPLVQKIGTYFYKVNIHAPYFINFADADATTYGNPPTVYRYGKAIKDTVMQQFGAYLAKISNWGDGPFVGKIGDQISNLGIIQELKNARAKEALVADFWLPDTEVGGGRDQEGSFKGFFFGAKGGFNAESHNHNDVGSCVMYYDGKPCLIDVGREEYTAKTFSSKRYEIWTMQSKFHNLPVINDVQQMDGANFKASHTMLKANPGSVSFTTDIAGAYPAEAMVKHWIRNYLLIRGNRFTITDQYELQDIKGITSSNLITYCKVSVLKPGTLIFDGDNFSLRMNYNPKIVKPVINFIEIKDRALKHYWPIGVTQLQMEFIKPEKKGKLEFVFTPVR